VVNPKIKELTIILVSAIVLSLTVLFRNVENFLVDFGLTFLSFIIILSVSILAKKIVAYHYEADITTKFWEFYRYGLKKSAHLKKPTPMIWLPVVLTLFSQGKLWWLAVLEFDVKARPERVSKRHGLYRFSEMTERHIATIAMWGVISCLILSILGYLTGFESFAKLSALYATWSIIPFSGLDGSKIFFGNKGTWTTITIITLFVLAGTMMI
jgi:hypothetical protein